MLPYVWTQKLIKERSGGSTKTVGDVVQMRRMVWTYRQVSSDPRLSGRMDTVINIDQRQSDLSAAMWGTSRLRNADGTWVQKWTGGIAAGGDVASRLRQLQGDRRLRRPRRARQRLVHRGR